MAKCELIDKWDIDGKQAELWIIDGHLQVRHRGTIHNIFPTITESKIVKPYLERLKERLTKKKPTYNPPQITYDAGVFDALELSISEIDTMLSELKKGSGE